MKKFKPLFLLLSLVGLLTACINPGQSGDPLFTGDGEWSTTIQMTYSYKTDVSASEAYFATGFDPAYLLLANKSHPLGSGHVPPNLTTLTCPTNGGKTVELDARAAEALYAMLLEMEADGMTDIKVTSGYRGYAYQSQLFTSYVSKEMNTISSDARAYFGNDYIQANYVSQGLRGLSREDAEAVAASYSARAGYSEHQTGLCIDFVTSDAGLTLAFENTNAFRWLSQNCYRFGFILRYPADKVAVTGYTYEPWHYRFVGREAATEIMLRGLTLEELLGEVG